MKWAARTDSSLTVPQISAWGQCRSWVPVMTHGKSHCNYQNHMNLGRWLALTHMLARFFTATWDIDEMDSHTLLPKSKGLSSKFLSFPQAYTFILSLASKSLLSPKFFHSVSLDLHSGTDPNWVPNLQNSCLQNKFKPFYLLLTTKIYWVLITDQTPMWMISFAAPSKWVAPSNPMKDIHNHYL